MAIDITVNLVDELEAELLAQVADRNRVFAGDPITPAQWLRQDVRDRLTLSAQQRADRRGFGFRDTYNAATPEDRAVMDALRVKYEG